MVTPLSKFIVGKKSIASVLGVSPSTIERWRKKYPNFPVHKKGGLLFCDPVALSAWVIAEEPVYEKQGQDLYARAYDDAGGKR